MMGKTEVAYVVAFCEIGIQQSVQEHVSVTWLVSYTVHSCWHHALGALPVELLILTVLLSLLGDFRRFGIFLSLKSVLVEIGKRAKKVIGERELRFHDCLSLFT